MLVKRLTLEQDAVVEAWTTDCMIFEQSFCYHWTILLFFWLAINMYPWSELCNSCMHAKPWRYLDTLIYTYC